MASKLQKFVGTDGQPKRTQVGLDDAQPVAHGEEVQSDVQLVDLAVVQQQVAVGANQYGAVIEAVARPFDQASGDVNLVIACGMGQPVGVRARDGLGKFTGGGVSPPQVEALGQNDQPATSCSSLADSVHGPVKVLLGTAPLHHDLRHSEPHGCYFRLLPFRAS